MSYLSKLSALESKALVVSRLLELLNQANKEIRLDDVGTELERKALVIKNPELPRAGALKALIALNTKESERDAMLKRTHIYFDDLSELEIFSSFQTATIFLSQEWKTFLGEKKANPSYELPELLKERLISTFLRLPIAVAVHYAGESLPFTELIAEANVALIESIENRCSEKTVSDFVLGVILDLRLSVLNALEEEASYMNAVQRLGKELQQKEENTEAKP